MSALKKTLTDFQYYILNKDGEIQNQVVGPNAEFRQTRLNVYYEAYSLRLLEILGKAFPALKSLMGDVLFEKMGRDYIAAYPSHHFSIRFFGQYFSKFLSTHAQDDPVFAEMARFEWALEDVIDAPDGPHLTFEDMAALSPDDWANLSLKTHSSLSKVAFFYFIPTLWEHLEQEKEKPDMVRQDKPMHWLVWRFERRALFRPMCEQQLAMLQLIQEGRTFSDICTELSASMNEDEVVNFAAQTLRQWIQEGIFSEFKVG